MGTADSEENIDDRSEISVTLAVDFSAGSDADSEVASETIM